MLSSKLNESGWTDGVRNQSKGASLVSLLRRAGGCIQLTPVGRARTRDGAALLRLLIRGDVRARPECVSLSSPHVNIITITSNIYADSMPLAVRKQITALIRAALDKQFE